LDESFTPDICRSVDKLDKTTWKEVEAELAEKNIPAGAIAKLETLLQRELTLANLALELKDSATGMEGIHELHELFKYLEIMGIPQASYRFDLSLARGLDYYTGPIFETKLPDHPLMGSLTGGGRYDTLIGMFTGKEMPAVGTTLGLDRIYTAMQQLSLLDDVKTSTKVLVGNFGEGTLTESLKLVSELRKAGINTEFYPEESKLKKQFSYCDKKKIPFMCIIGETEQAAGNVSLKNMQTGEQTTRTIPELITIFKESAQ
jgi:histidyl-tRNA synthetase